MSAILKSLNAHNLPIFQPILMILVSKFMLHIALSDKTYLSLELLSPLNILCNSYTTFIYFRCRSSTSKFIVRNSYVAKVYHQDGVTFLHGNSFNGCYSYSYVSNISTRTWLISMATELVTIVTDTKCPYLLGHALFQRQQNLSLLLQIYNVHIY